MTIRAQGNRIFYGVISLIRKTYLMMNLKVWCPAVSSIERSRIFAMLAYTMCHKKNLCDNIRISAIAWGNYLDSVWLLVCGGKPFSSFD